MVGVLFQHLFGSLEACELDQLLLLCATKLRTFLVLLCLEMSYDLTEQSEVFGGQLLSRWLRHDGRNTKLVEVECEVESFCVRFREQRLKILQRYSMYRSKTGCRSRMRLQGSTREIRSDEVWFDIEKGYMRSSPSLVGYFNPLHEPHVDSLEQ